MRRRVPDTSKIERVLGWRPTASLDQILSEVIDHVRAAGAHGSPERAVLGSA
jgi:nucleoside-diphosphate-sugar epimerase